MASTVTAFTKTILVYLYLATLWPSQCIAQQLTANLDYGTFRGTYSSKYNISYWRKIPFAAPPVGENRFRAPQPPLPITTGTYNSDQSYEFCPQRTVNGSEDCLYLGLFSRPWSSPQPLRPVVVNFYGGGFIQGGGSFNIPPAGYPILNVSKSNDFIFVYPNYRVNAFGFLPGAEVAASETSDLNAGLLDQQAVLNWTNKYIEQFGGNPLNVSIFGQSAGAGSVVAQVIANGGKTQPKLFTKALASSPYWPKNYKYNSPEAQAVYDNFARLAGCSGTNSLKCLKSANLQTLRTASLAVSSSHTWNTSSYTWAPVIDGVFLTQSLSQATIKGEVNIDFGFGMYNQNEGENFVPSGLQNAKSTGTPPFNSSIASFDTWLKGFLPYLSDQNLSSVRDFYPQTSTEEFFTYSSSYPRAGFIYRDIVLACPTYWTARAAHNKSYVGQYTISPAKHASDTSYWNQVNAIQTSQPLIYKGFTGAFASFFQTGDPNAHKLTAENVLGVPESWGTGEEFLIESKGFENPSADGLDKRCGFWRQLADQIPI